jgi:hypothetical protein
MPTTVQIDEKTKEALLRFASRLQGRLGRKVTFDEAIAALVAVADGSAEAREKFVKLFGSMRGERGAWRELEALRRSEKSAIERKAR